MPKIAYEERKFRAGSLALIRQMDDIVTDYQRKGYQLKYGVKSWELDALRPEVIESMIDEHIKQNMDMTLFNETLQQEQEQEQELYQIAYNYQGALMGAAGE